MPNKFYTIDQVAEILDMHHKTIRKFITDGKLGASKIGKQWRISEYELNSFMENNRDKSIGNPEVGFSIQEGPATFIKKRINVSTVIDISEIDKDQYMRISNALIAIMNCKDPEMQNSTIHMKYNEKENRLKVLLWGQVKFTEEMLDSITLLVEATNQ
ncbi:helix-turn-helix domain-containing protein [Clostridium aminobutyricum]|uniref:Helix-turn-helix domain-containing protein n=1 Tax=Clostridium aminobutyricum TaxID=33953 RepID=A0A939D9H2_CLOAM|nr:helix-turn-helix domain-containing protein [Clostridium aminobutyricum]MBN7773631.1 helix-turn-helix domain-containing protein [Clostridium aminobutyricum]